MGRVDPETLRAFAAKYVWWKSPDEAIASPSRVVAQVMNLGEFDDVAALERLLGGDALRAVLLHAEAGQFNERSWHYWHYRLGLATVDHVPPLPTRSLG